MRLFSLLILFVCFISSCTNTDTYQLEERVDALFDTYNEEERPGFAIGIVREGELIYANGFGQADVRSNDAITPDTAFNIASLSKQFTAAATAMDIQAGRIGLDDRLSDHWNDLPEFMSEISISHLVYMTSGLPEYYTLPSPVGGWASEDEFTVDDAIGAVLAAGRLQYAPGAQWSYSNINYQLLAEVSARVNGQPFSTLMRDRVFAPLEMTDSWVDAPIDRERERRATSYVWDGDGWHIAPRLSPHYGGSGVFASVRDLAKWDRALYSEMHFGEDFTDLMLSTRAFDHDKTNDAFGLVHGDYRGQPTIWYEGGDYGVSAYMVRLPERDETVICLANFANAGCVSKSRMVIDVLMAFR